MKKWLKMFILRRIVIPILSLLPAAILALGFLIPAKANALMLWPDPTIGITHIMNGTDCVGHPGALAGWIECNPTTWHCDTLRPAEPLPAAKSKKVPKRKQPKKSEDLRDHPNALALLIDCGDDGIRVCSVKRGDCVCPTKSPKLRTKPKAPDKSIPA